jgi:tetraacyldisaccharide 4'-kinase
MQSSTAFSSIILRPFSWIYRSAVKARNSRYDQGQLPVRKAEVPVVSIGNIEAGGTGKTPFTIALARELHQRGLLPVIVTRGYKGRLDGVVEVTSRHSFLEVGDEALLMARTAGVPVVKSPDRFQGAEFARRVFKADVVLLDDGFQHRKLHRDLDIVLLSRDVAGLPMLPAGPLREPADSLGRAHIIVHTKGSSEDGITAALIPTGLVDSVGREYGLSALDGSVVLAVSGIGRPEYFKETLVNLGARVVSLSFRDHHVFTPGDVRKIKVRQEKFDLVVLTEKDMVRLDPSVPDAKWVALRVEMQVDGMESIAGEIEDIVKKRGVPRQG